MPLYYLPSLYFAFYAFVYVFVVSEFSRILLLSRIDFSWLFIHLCNFRHVCLIYMNLKELNYVCWTIMNRTLGQHSHLFSYSFDRWIVAVDYIMFRLFSDTPINLLYWKLSFENISYLSICSKHTTSERLSLPIHPSFGLSRCSSACLSLYIFMQL